YLRRGDDGAGELWMLTAGASAPNGQRLVGGVAGDRFALSPDGERVALALDSRDGGRSQIAVVDSRSGTVQARYGPGAIATRAWLPDGSG
ncbi:MAG: hypothetical protein GWO39_03725, partial [Gammaproteobacteria bacterium]|nr:hypothetical protein [Gammaproteobacteria bacterium]NIY31506.1 hypothetical protein [Gammaproteobacteria bacterium]